MNTEDNRKAPELQAIDNNPCGICRVLGLPFCRGHGGGSDEQEDQNSKKDFESKKINSFFEDNIAWQENATNDFLYQYSNPFSAFSITVDLARGNLLLIGPEFANIDEQKVLETLHQAISKLLQGTEINSDKLIKTANSLKIEGISSAKFDSFITKLLEKNLLPTQLPENSHNISQHEKQTELNTYKTPRPFDITNGPGFMGIK